MGISMYLVGLPIVVLIVSVILGGGNLQGQNQVYVICNSNTPQCSSQGNQVISCAPNFFSFPCNIFANKCVVPPYPPPAYCTGGLIQQTLLPAGTSITVNSAIQAAASTSSAVFFQFGNIGSNGFIAMIGLIVGIVALAGLSIFGSGEQSESVHILFMGGLMMGIWFFLSGIDGVLTGSPNSFFTQLNGPLTSPGAGNAFGTELYVALTFMYLVGFMTMVKRGGGAE